MSEISNFDKTNPGDADSLATSAGDLRNNFVGLGVMVGPFMRNLVVTNASAATIDIDADMVLIENTDSPPLPYLARSVNLTATISSSGANGLDTGSEANDTWYFCWIIYNASTDTVASLLSTSSTLASITLPSGYTFGKFVGVAYNDSSGDFLDFLQRDDRVSYKGDQLILDNGRSDAAWGSITISAFVPTVAKRVFGRGLMLRSTGTPTNCSLLISADGSGNYPHGYILGDLTAANTNFGGYYEQELTSTSTMFYQTLDTAGTIAADLWIMGYWITI